MPAPKANTLAERYDRALRYQRGKPLSAAATRPLPTCHWPKENLECIERYRAWLLSGGVSEMVTSFYHVMMAGHVFGLTLKPYSQLDPDRDLECALEYIQSKGLSWEWTRNCRNSLKHFRRYLRLQRGLGEESKITPFDVAAHTQGLPEWVVSELERYQHLLQRNWRTARIDLNLRCFWSKHLLMWRFFCEKRGVQKLADLKRQFVLDYLDARLSTGHAVRGVNAELRLFHTFLLFLQEEGYSIPNSLLRIPGLKMPESLPRYLTDEQIRKLRDEAERRVSEAKLASRRRFAILVRAIFYLLWQGGLRISEAEELRMEDLDLAHKRISVRDGKGRKDRTVYLAPTAVSALQEYLLMRGEAAPSVSQAEGSGDHVFLFRNAPLRKDFIRGRLSAIGEKVGVKVYPHRLRHTCATQLLNAGCRITSIQRFLGHKELSSTMIYARAHDQTVAEDYFAAMERVELRLQIGEEKQDEVVKVQGELFQLIAQLELPELCLEERLGIAGQLRSVLGIEQEHACPMVMMASPVANISP